MCASSEMLKVRLEDDATLTGGQAAGRLLEKLVSVVFEWERRKAAALSNCPVACAHT